MLYAATSIWLMLIALLAWAVHRLWGGATQPRVVNALLLPASAVVQVIHVITLLATGRSIENTQPRPPPGDKPEIGEDEKRPKLPFVIGSASSLLPMFGLFACLGVLVSKMGEPVMAKLPGDLIAKDLPTSLPAFWEQLRRFISLAEATLNCVREAGPAQFKIALFVYLLTCLTVRMGPLPGKTSGHFAGIAGLGAGAALAATLTPHLASGIERAWPILTLALGWLLLLMLASMVLRAVVSAIQVIVKA